MRNIMNNLVLIAVSMLLASCILVGAAAISAPIKPLVYSVVTK